MKTKLLILALCALALASCNNEPEIVLGEDALPAVAMAIIDKPIAEAEDYLVNIHYARNFTGIKEIDNSTQARDYFRPEEVLKLLNVNNGNTLQEQLQNALYERLYFNTHKNKLFYTIGTQQFDSPKMALANFRAWLKYVDELMTDSATWMGIIRMYHSLDLNDTATVTFYYGGVKAEEYLQIDKEMGWASAPREEFYKALNSLTPKQLFQISVAIENANRKDIVIGYNTLEHQYVGVPSVGYVEHIVTTDVNRRTEFSCVSHANSTD